MFFLSLSFSRISLPQNTKQGDLERDQKVTKIVNFDRIKNTKLMPLPSFRSHPVLPNQFKVRKYCPKEAACASKGSTGICASAERNQCKPFLSSICILHYQPLITFVINRYVVAILFLSCSDFKSQGAT